MCPKEERMHYARIMAKEGHSQLEIAEKLGVSDRMVRKYLDPDFSLKKRKKRASKLDPFKATIDSILTDSPFFNLERLAERLEKQGYSGGMTILRNYAASFRKGLITRAVRRFETEPGFQAQVDWKECGKMLIDGTERKVYAFVMIMGYSRKAFVFFTLDMTEYTLLAAHLAAFAFFGGVPAEILYDNMKTAWLHGESGWRVHPKLLSLASYCGFTPRRCQVRRPQTKGKVERFIGFLGHNFLPGISENACGSLAELNGSVLQWLKDIDTRQLRQFRETRNDRFRKEQPLLKHWNAEAAPDVRETIDLRVSREGLVLHKSNQYSIPADYIGQLLVMKYDRITGMAELFHGKTFIRRFAVSAEGSRQKNIRAEDKKSLQERWDRENRGKLALHQHEKQKAAALPESNRGISIETRNPSEYDLLTAVSS